SLMTIWLERNVYVNYTLSNAAAHDLSSNDLLGMDQPGLDDMTLKALEVLRKRGGDDGFFLMSEAASVDKSSTTWTSLVPGLILEMDTTINKT
ncbi:hypothetical protein BJV82DRAFT_485975, partial [Fennellomyces sp. T-0311]